MFFPARPQVGLLSFLKEGNTFSLLGCLQALLLPVSFHPLGVGKWLGVTNRSVSKGGR